MKTVKIIIPFYKDSYDENDVLSLDRTFALLGNYPIVFVVPESLETAFITNHPVYKNASIERFENHFFKNIDGYNQLMLSPVFYKRFIATDYILICQTDVFVFKNELEKWINLDFDYVGAPWIGSPKTFISTVIGNVNSIYRKITQKKEKNKERLFMVGNGGFSLRKVASFYKIGCEEQNNIQEFTLNKPSNDYYIEDVFWSLYIPERYLDFKIPDWKLALNFCIDRRPEIALKLNHGNLPMACHGFNKPNVAAFWKSIFNNLSNTIRN